MRARGALGALAAAVLVGSMFLDWYTNTEAIELLEMLRERADDAAAFPLDESDINVTAWDSAFGTVVTLLLALCGAAGVGAGLSLALRTKLAERPQVMRDLASVLVVAGGLATGLIFYRLIDFPVEPVRGSLSAEPGLFVGLVAAVALAISGMLAVFEARRAGDSASDG